jgi:hypothetical protein
MLNVVGAIYPSKYLDDVMVFDLGLLTGLNGIQNVCYSPVLKSQPANRGWEETDADARYHYTVQGRPTINGEGISHFES